MSAGDRFKTISNMLAVLTFVVAGIAVVSGAPDNRGTEFVIGYMENRDLTMDVELYITTSRTSTVFVQVTAPKFPQINLNQEFTITSGEVKQLKFPNSIRAYKTAKETKGILVTASDEVVVYGTNMERYSNDAFLAFPTDVLGMEYYVVTQWPSSPLLCEFLVVGVEDGTTVTILYGGHSDVDVSYNNQRYRSKSTQTITLDRFDTYQAQSQGDLTSSFITADKKISVFSGNSRTYVNPWTYGKGTLDAIVDMILPLDTWGKEFAIVPTPHRTTGDQIKFLAGKEEANVNVKCSGSYSESFSINAGDYKQYVTPSDEVCHVSSDQGIMVILFVISQLHSSEPADPSIITIPPIAQYAADYTFATPKYSLGGPYENFFMFIVDESEKSGLKIDETAFPSNTKYTKIPNTNYVGGFISVSDGSHTVRHDSPISVFGGFLYGMAHAESYGMPTGLRLAPVNKPCVKSTSTTGDGFDNDCDGKIDEEICTASPAVDDDGDGLIDEDCAQPLPIDGKWSDWSAWENTCYCSGQTGQRPRRRKCNNPEPQYDGKQCAGDDTDYQSCTPNGGACPVDGGYTTWSSWGSCSQTCGTGVLRSSRACTNPSPAHGGRDCTVLGIAEMTKNCYNNEKCPDPINGGYTTWTAWVTCPVTCGTSTTKRSRTCSNPSPQHGGSDCTSLGSASETTNCDTKVSCPVDGGYSSWSAWGTCSATCATGKQQKTRACTSPSPAHGGSDCTSLGASTETKTCDTKVSCPVDGGYTSWTAWGTCSVTCATGSQQRKRSCTSPSPAYGGSDCTSIGAATETQTCDTKISCPVDGGYSAWSDWGTCSVTCATGKQQRKRACSNPSPAHGGSDCTSLGAATETQTCDTKVFCKVDGGYTTWTAWGTCSVTCATGDQQRKRSCTSPSPAYGGSDCTSIGAASETQKCDTKVNCPVDGGYTAWAAWGTCSVTCATGSQERARSCTSPSPAYGGSDCTSIGADSDTKTCDTNVICPIDGGYTAWTSWTSCPVTCSTSTVQRSRTCSSPSPAHGGQDCTSLGANSETKACDTKVHCPVDGGYASWSSWGTCSVTCATGTVQRSRSCSSPSPAHGGSDCTSLGDASETKSCDTNVICPVHGGYSTWSAWGTCDVTCSVGTAQRTRTCTNPSPLHNGRDCTSFGAATDTQSCDTNVYCPIDGGYTSWTAWGACGVTCGVGDEQRTRNCTSPTPAYGGADCSSLGNGTEIQSCDTNVTCPSVDGGWNVWGSWTNCTKSCGGGMRLRVRLCDSPVPSNGGLSCQGDSIEMEKCNNDACASAGGSGGSTLNGFSNQVCPNGFFPCRSGYITCIETEFACDCASDCSDGSDESGDWAMCSSDALLNCENGAEASFSRSHVMFALALQLLVGLIVHL